MTMLIKQKSLRNQLTGDALQDISLLIQQEAEYLDQNDYDKWLTLFTEDCIYWVPATPGQSDAENHISLFYEDRSLMKLRIEKLRHPQSHPMVYPLRCSHVLSDKVIEKYDEDTEELVVSVRFLVTEYYRDEQRQFAGSYEYRLKLVGGSYLIRMKRVNLINCDGVLEPVQVFL